MSGVLVALIGLNRPSLTVKLNTTRADGYRYGTGTVSTVETVIATPFGGRAPYTYSWVRVSGSSAINPTNPNGPNTKFSSYFSSSGYRVATFKCTVTDVDSLVVDSATIPVTLESF